MFAICSSNKNTSGDKSIPATNGMKALKGRKRGSTNSSIKYLIWSFVDIQDIRIEINIKPVRNEIQADSNSKKAATDTPTRWKLAPNMKNFTLK